MALCIEYGMALVGFVAGLCFGSLTVAVAVLLTIRAMLSASKRQRKWFIFVVLCVLVCVD